MDKLNYSEGSTPMDKPNQTERSTPVDKPNHTGGSTPMDKLNYTIWRRIYTHRWSMDTLLHSGGCRAKVSLDEPSVT